jgi:hypothetical protein
MFRVFTSDAIYKFDTEGKEAEDLALELSQKFGGGVRVLSMRFENEPERAATAKKQAKASTPSKKR